MSAIGIDQALCHPGAPPCQNALEIPERPIPITPGEREDASRVRSITVKPERRGSGWYHDVLAAHLEGVE
jgi:hypothetical protein